MELDLLPHLTGSMSALNGFDAKIQNSYREIAESEGSTLRSPGINQTADNRVKQQRKTRVHLSRL
jgi:hypothetical protein